MSDEWMIKFPTLEKEKQYEEDEKEKKGNQVET